MKDLAHNSYYRQTLDHSATRHHSHQLSVFTNPKPPTSLSPLSKQQQHIKSFDFRNNQQSLASTLEMTAGKSKDGNSPMNMIKAFKTQQTSKSPLCNKFNSS